MNDRLSGSRRAYRAAPRLALSALLLLGLVAWLAPQAALAGNGPAGLGAVRLVQAPAAPAPAAAASAYWRDCTITRDTWGVPHIAGRTPEATFFGFGYAQAEDHGELLLRHYRLAAGETAEAFGNVRSPLAAVMERGGLGPLAALVTNSLVDEMVRLFDIPRVARQKLARLAKPQRRLLEAFAAGANAQLQTRADRPAWMRDVTPADPLIFARFIAFSRALEFIGREPLRQPQRGQRGSNQWVVAPKKTADGSLMFHMDPHLDYRGISQWYEAHLKTPGWQMRGATFFGMPMLVMGFTDKLAWSMTRNMPDVADVYVEKINPANRNQYWDAAKGMDGGWAEMTTRTETLKIKGPDGALTERTLTLRATKHGPVLPALLSMRVAPNVFAAKSSLLERLDFLTELLAMARAKNMTMFKAALAQQMIPLWNIMAGSRDGDIFSVYNCYAPKRTGKFDAARPLPGDDPNAEWQGYYTFDELPKLENPASGWLQNCNQPPWLNTVNSGLKTTWPRTLIPGTRHTGRSRRITELLDKPTKLTAKQFRAFGQDAYVGPAATLVLEIIGAWVKLGDSYPDEDGALKKALGGLAAWDFQATADSVPATHFLLWYEASGRPWSRKLRRGEALKQAELLKEYVAALRRLQRATGSLDVPWGFIHGFKRGDRWFGLPGATGIVETLRAAFGPRRGEKLRRTATFGSSFLQDVIFRPDGRTEAYSCVPFGASENPKSPHFADQALLYSQGKMKPAWWTAAEIAANAEHLRGTRAELRLSATAPVLVLTATDATRPFAVTVTRGALAPPGQRAVVPTLTIRGDNVTLTGGDRRADVRWRLGAGAWQVPGGTALALSGKRLHIGRFAARRGTSEGF